MVIAIRVSELKLGGSLFLYYRPSFKTYLTWCRRDYWNLGGKTKTHRVYLDTILPPRKLSFTTKLSSHIFPNILHGFPY